MPTASGVGLGIRGQSRGAILPSGLREARVCGVGESVQEGGLRGWPHFLSSPLNQRSKFKELISAAQTIELVP